MGGERGPSRRGIMKRRRMVAALTLAVLTAMVCLAVPTASSDEAYAIEHDDFKVMVPFHDPTAGIPNIVENGKSATYSIYISNFSDHVLDISFVGSVSDSYLSFDTPESLTVMRAGDPEGRDMVKTSFTIYVEEVTTSHKGGMVYLHVRIADVDDESIDLVPITFGIDVKSNFDTSGNFNRFFGIIDNTLPAPYDTPFVPFIVTLLGVLALAFVAVRLVIPLFSKYVEDDKRRYENIMTLLVLIIAVALFIDPGLRILGADLNLILQVQKLSVTLLVVMICVTIWKLFMMLAEGLLRKLGEKENSPLDSTFLPLFSMIAKFVLWIGGIGVILHVFGFDLTGILISAGIVTLGITLGAQSVLSQLFNGISLLLTRPFNEGDYLLIDGTTYVVRQVKLMYTEFTSEDTDRIITIPNNTVAAATIVNMSKYDKAYRMKITFQVPYGEDIKKVERVLLEMADENEYVMHNYRKYKKPAVRLIEFEDSGILMRLDVTVTDYANTPTIMSDIKKALYATLREENIEMPFNRLEVSIMEGGYETDPTA